MGYSQIRTSPISLPDNYRFHFHSPDGDLSTSTIYFERHGNGVEFSESTFLGSLEFINSESLEKCFKIVLASEKRKVNLFGGLIHELDENSQFEFLTEFSMDGKKFNHYHLVNTGVGKMPFHVALLKGFNRQDINSVKLFWKNLNIGDISIGAIEGSIMEIYFNDDCIKNRSGQIFYLN